MRITGPIGEPIPPVTWTSATGDCVGYRATVTEQPSFHGIPETPLSPEPPPIEPRRNAPPGRRPGRTAGVRGALPPSADGKPSVGT
jgi:hypothetical protein